MKNYIEIKIFVDNILQSNQYMKSDKMTKLFKLTLNL